MSWSVSEILKLFKNLAVVYNIIGLLKTKLNLMIHSGSFFKQHINYVDGGS